MDGFCDGTAFDSLCPNQSPTEKLKAARLETEPSVCQNLPFPICPWSAGFLPRAFLPISSLFAFLL